MPNTNKKISSIIIITFNRTFSSGIILFLRNRKVANSKVEDRIVRKVKPCEYFVAKNQRGKEKAMLIAITARNIKINFANRWKKD